MKKRLADELDDVDAVTAALIELLPDVGPEVLVTACSRFLGWMAATAYNANGAPLSLPDCVADVAKLMTESYAQVQNVTPTDQTTH
jgi:hypothetical protein